MPQESFTYQPCGCTNTLHDEVVVSYTPCLSCALMNAGNMLQEAGKRIKESVDKERDELEARAEEARVEANKPDFIQGSE